MYLVLRKPLLKSEIDLVLITSSFVSQPFRAIPTPYFTNSMCCVHKMSHKNKL